MNTLVEIPVQELNELNDRLLWLKALECAGVYNWCGFDDALDIYREWKEDEAA